LNPNNPNYSQFQSTIRTRREKKEDAKHNDSVASKAA
jgi:hypothetical protein